MMINKFAAVSKENGICWYRVVAEGDVASEDLRTVESVFAILATELNIEPSSLHVMWAKYEDARVAEAQRGEMPHEQDIEPFKESNVALLPCTFGGLVPNLSTSVIIINAALLSIEYLIHTAIEELFHIHQHRTLPPEQLKDAQNCELSAAEYVERTMPSILDALRKKGELSP
jgi:hypothetical protein